MSSQRQKYKCVCVSSYTYSLQPIRLILFNRLPPHLPVNTPSLTRRHVWRQRQGLTHTHTHKDNSVKCRTRENAEMSTTIGAIDRPPPWSNDLRIHTRTHTRIANRGGGGARSPFWVFERLSSLADMEAFDWPTKGHTWRSRVVTATHKNKCKDQIINSKTRPSLTRSFQSHAPSKCNSVHCPLVVRRIFQHLLGIFPSLFPSFLHRRRHVGTDSASFINSEDRPFLCQPFGSHLSQF